MTDEEKKGAPDAKVCSKCGRPHGSCRAHNRQGLPCNRPAGGKPVCMMHGGKSPQVIAKYEREQALALASSTMVTYGAPVSSDPLNALVEEIARTAGHVRWLGKVIEDLEPEALVWNTTEKTTRDADGFNAVSYKDVSKTATPSVWITLYQGERKHLIDACKTAIQCGVAERQIRLAEQQGELIAAVIRGVLNDPELALTPDQQARAGTVASRHLRVVA